MKKVLFLLAAGVFAFSLCLATPASLFAEEYSLDDLFRIALARSEKLKMAEENLAIAETGKDKAFSYLLPRLTATGGYTQYSEKKFTATGGVLQPELAYTWGIRAEETVSLGGRELTALGISRQNVTKSRHDLTAVREDYLLRYVAVAYYNCLMARKNLDIADANLQRLQKHRDAAEQRLKIGEVTKTALLRAEGELSGAKSESLQAQNGLELALAVLASNAGIRVPYTLSEVHAAEEEIKDLPLFQQQAFAARADLKSLDVQKQIAADQIRIAEGASWPSLSLFGVYAGTDQSPAASNLNRESIYAGVALNFPFFDGGLRKADVSEAKSRERQAALQVEEMKKGIDIEVRSVYLDVVTQKGILRFLNDQLLFARDNYRAVERQFNFGLANSLDVMDANTLLVSAERKVASAIYNYQLSLLRMKKATGTLLASLAVKP
ncbi:MAG: TolC family protein [Proteobacteria bacterium]|nr:TolC family protein [Pseudomonadota bacterium]MBU4580866.1 TolC family protein [Pseudomonadota bacterium]MCG2739661.1 TolC family protein [Syntrophaceae bacterium]